ncbi:hypothetical protein [Agaribacter flavus]|uniref:Transcriptional regulator n=1 Tax=Agaribacter flavus TaxID=1902781 RepID=A0ABV7FT50_9ALTE
MIIAVETADLVNSTQLTHEDFMIVSNAIDNELTDNKDRYTLVFERFRGDAHQVTYFQAEYAVRISLLVRLATYIALPAHHTLLTQSLLVGSQAKEDKMGAVYIASGRHLDKLKRSGFLVDFISDTYTMALPSQFMQALLNGLTSKQAQALYWYIKLGFPDQQTIAKHLNMTRQNVNTHLQRANSDLVKAFIDTYEANVTQLKQEQVVPSSGDKR